MIEQTFYRWKRQYGGLGVSELRQMKQLREGNASLKRLVADLSLDKRMLQEVLAKSLKPARMRRIVDWLKGAFPISTRRACGLQLYWHSSYYYRPKLKDHRAVLLRLKELAYTRVRYGYRRLTVLLQREGWRVGKKLVYRLYRQENLCVRTKQRKKRAAQTRVPLAAASAANQRWSMNFLSERFKTGFTSGG